VNAGRHVCVVSPDGLDRLNFSGLAPIRPIEQMNYELRFDIQVHDGPLLGHHCFDNQLLSMDTSTAKHAAEMPPARTHVIVNAAGSSERAQVKWFDRLRGFGFLTRGERDCGHFRA
jgi:hypothetical protein